jgi:F-type H+-transporting ATPase subunit b
MFLVPDGTIVVQLINFVIFFALLTVVFIRPVGRAIRERREYLTSLTADYDRYQEEAGKLRAEAEGIRAGARREAAEAIARARAHATDEAAALTSQYAANVQATIDGANKTAASELDAARAGENETVQQLANLILERTLSEPAR